MVKNSDWYAKRFKAGEKADDAGLSEVIQDLLWYKDTILSVVNIAKDAAEAYATGNILGGAAAGGDALNMVLGWFDGSMGGDGDQIKDSLAKI